MIKNYQLSGTDFSVAGEASSNFKGILKRLGVPADIVRKVAIAMYEAEINTIIHGKGGEVDVQISSDKITIVFTDHGPGIPDVDKAMQAGFSTATDEARELGFGAGMGLPNMKKYSDEMFIETEVGKGTKVTLIIYLG